MATNKELLNKLDYIESKLPNDELKQTHKNVRDIKEILLNVEDGVVVKVDKNTSWRKTFDFDEFELLLKWKKYITYSMMTIYPILIGIIIKLIFF